MCGAVQVAKVVAPKKAALHEAEASYEEVMVGLRAKQAELKVAFPCHNCLHSALLMLTSSVQVR